MPNKKITALTAVTSPIDKTFDGIPFVQGGVTKKVSSEDLTGIYRVKITIPTADVLTLGTIPVVAIPAPGVGYAINILNVRGHNPFNATAYATGGTLTVMTDGATRPFFIFTYLPYATADMISSGILQDTTASNSTQLLENADIIITTTNGIDYTLGDSDLDIFIQYEILEL